MESAWPHEGDLSGIEQSVKMLGGLQRVRSGSTMNAMCGRRRKVAVDFSTANVTIIIDGDAAAGCVGVRDFSEALTRR